MLSLTRTCMSHLGSHRSSPDPCITCRGLAILYMPSQLFLDSSEFLLLRQASDYWKLATSLNSFNMFLSWYAKLPSGQWSVG